MLQISLLSAHNEYEFRCKGQEERVNTMFEQVMHVKPSVATFPLGTWAILTIATVRKWASEPRCTTFSWASAMSLSPAVVTYGILAYTCCVSGLGWRTRLNQNL